MIFKLKFKRNTKSETYLILKDDIWNGEYRKMFIDAFWKYKPMDQYKVNEFQSQGLLITLPAGSSMDLHGEPQLLELNVTKTEAKMKEVFETCQKRSSSPLQSLTT